MNAAPEKILVIKLGALGDFIQAMGPMAAIRKHHPAAELTLLTTAPYAELALASKYFDHVWIDEKPGWINIAGWMRLKKKLATAGFSRIYDLQNNDRTALYFKLFSKKPEWVGAAKGASHRNDSSERTAGHAFDGHAQTLALAGILNVTPDRLDRLDANISSFPLRRPYVLLLPGSSPQRPEKRWPTQHFARIAKILAQWGYQPIILGAGAETALAREIAKESPEILDLAGQTTLLHLPSLARGAAAAIGNDTGPMHLIAATGCPSLVLFSGKSDPVRHAPKGDHVLVLQSKNLQELRLEKVLQMFRPREEPPKSSVILH